MKREEAADVGCFGLRLVAAAVFGILGSSILVFFAVVIVLLALMPIFFIMGLH